MKFTATLFTLLFTTLSYGQLTSETMSVNGVVRNYQQYLPTGLDPNSESPSLIIVLHGLGGNSSQMVSAGFNLIADTARVVAIYPQGKPNQFGQNAWNNGTLAASTVDDLGFMHQLIDSAIVQYNVNPARVYFTGFSMGSIMSHHMACEMNNRVAAIGCMAGTMATSDIQNCVPVYATPVIHLHGTADGTVPYESGALPSLSLVPQTMAFWRNVHGCDATADSTRLPDIANDNITIDRFVYYNCNPTGSVELWRFNGAGHVYLYQPVNDITEGLEVWKFLSRWQHSNPTSVGIHEIPEWTSNVYPNPGTGVFTVDLSKSVVYYVTDALGTVLLEGTFTNGKNTLLLNEQPAGIYFLRLGDRMTRVIIQ